MPFNSFVDEVLWWIQLVTLPQIVYVHRVISYWCNRKRSNSSIVRLVASSMNQSSVAGAITVQNTSRLGAALIIPSLYEGLSFGIYPFLLICSEHYKFTVHWSSGNRCTISHIWETSVIFKISTSPCDTENDMPSLSVLQKLGESGSPLSPY